MIIRGFWRQNVVRSTFMKYSQTSIIRGPRLSAVFEAEIQYAQVPRIIEVWLYTILLYRWYINLIIIKVDNMYDVYFMFWWIKFKFFSDRTHILGDIVYFKSVTLLYTLYWNDWTDWTDSWNRPNNSQDRS